MSSVIVWLKPDSADPMTKMTMAVWKKTLRPYWSPSFPHSGVDTVEARRYEVTTHARCEPPCRSPTIVAARHARRPVGPRTSVCCRPDAARATVPTADAGALRRHRTRVGQGRPDPMRTRLTDLLGVEHPVMLAGMGGVSYAELAAAVSSAGGFGCLGASTMGDDKMVEEMAAVRAVTDKPF